MPLTDEVMRIQFYDKIDDCKTLEYIEHSYSLDEYKEKQGFI